MEEDHLLKLVEMLTDTHPESHPQCRLWLEGMADTGTASGKQTVAGQKVPAGQVAGKQIKAEVRGARTQPRPEASPTPKISRPAWARPVAISQDQWIDDWLKSRKSSSSAAAQSISDIDIVNKFYEILESQGFTRLSHGFSPKVVTFFQDPFDPRLPFIRVHINLPLELNATKTLIGIIKDQTTVLFEADTRDLSPTGIYDLAQYVNEQIS